MKLLIFTDNHGSLTSINRAIKKSKNVDLVIQAGDISVFEQSLGYLIKKISKIKKDVLILPGNHESDIMLKKETVKYKNIIFFHKKIKKIKDILFIGYGGEGFSERSKDFESFIRKNKKTIKGKIVLIIHQPPYGAVDLVGKYHSGNKSFRDFIDKYKPILVICGHLHENEKQQKKIKKTLVINPGPDGKMIKI